ncbi:MAG: AraC family transcriptional regulator [Cohaesibacteraceae bacterium]|nr:AraC family transcriptional regulator [Cohaesibacteraceae bacterium]
MKPFLEKPLGDPNASWARLDRRLDDCIPFQWHHHIEYELTLTLNSRGQRFIGDHTGEYDDGDLVLIGPNLPHTWASRDKYCLTEPHVALVMHLHPAWLSQLTSSCVEFGVLDTMLQRAGKGLHFAGAASDAARDDIEALFAKPSSEGLLDLLGILMALTRDDGAVILASTGPSNEQAGENAGRLDRVLNHIHSNYHRGISLEELADIAALSPSGLHRLFRKHTHTTISGYLMRMRIGDACARLSSGEQPVAFIADAVGYQSLANFNRQFRALNGMTPRAYRARFR